MSTDPSGADPEDILELDPSEARSWLQLLGLGGEDARAWVATYRELGGDGISDRLDRSVRLMRKRQLDEAGEALAACRRDIETKFGQAEPSLALMLESRYHSAAAYLFYCRADQAGLDDAFAQMTRVTAEAIEISPFLLFLATRFFDVEMQQALFARNLHRWEEVEKRIAAAAAMVDGQRPLYRASRGDVYFSTLAEHLIEMANQTERRVVVGKVVDPQWRRRKFEAMVAEVHALPWLAIPYG